MERKIDMKILNAEIKNNVLEFDDTNAGNAFDHKVTQLSILVPEEYADNDIFLYQLLFQTSEQKAQGTAFITAAGYLTVNSENKVVYALPQIVMRSGDLDVQFRIYNQTLQNLVHTSQAVLKVGDTLPGGDQFIDDQYVGLFESEYQRKLTAGNNIDITQDNTIQDVYKRQIWR